MKGLDDGKGVLIRDRLREIRTGLGNVRLLLQMGGSLSWEAVHDLEQIVATCTEIIDRERANV